MSFGKKFALNLVLTCAIALPLVQFLDVKNGFLVFGMGFGVSWLVDALFLNKFAAN